MHHKQVYYIGWKPGNWNGSQDVSSFGLRVLCFNVGREQPYEEIYSTVENAHLAERFLHVRCWCQWDKAISVSQEKKIRCTWTGKQDEPVGYRRIHKEHPRGMDPASTPSLFINFHLSHVTWTLMPNLLVKREINQAWWPSCLSLAGIPLVSPVIGCLILL